ncbi:hypothetical protein [Mycolicibacter acidiphilus]|uniref:hypothetical protein n=1 Tax=Mycolicibacter acidiphilus TaxID=2835306 RepID=UPI001BD3CB3D|nr:hypothetical protein [Mycolicibacter acidiphilus]
MPGGAVELSPGEAVGAVIPDRPLRPVVGAAPAAAAATGTAVAALVTIGVADPAADADGAAAGWLPRVVGTPSRPVSEAGVFEPESDLDPESPMDDAPFDPVAVVLPAPEFVPATAVGWLGLFICGICPGWIGLPPPALPDEGAEVAGVPGAVFGFGVSAVV